MTPAVASNALVTGGTSQTGSECVRALRRHGAAVLFTGADRERGDAIALELGATFVECDHRDRGATDRALEHALTRCEGRLDALVTISDTRVLGSLEATAEADFRELVELNLTSPFRVARACLAALAATGRGSIVLVGSDAGIRAAHETAAYSVTSAGVIALAELLAAEGAPLGVRANAVCPPALPELTPPSGRTVAGADVAALVTWLASGSAAHLTGATLRLDGGAGAALLAYTRA
jgi:meso-butanediol dehydrogenase / (S,S)-butanediol dehydrogenase / diacetyl reductase